MFLLGEVARVVERLAGRGWGALLARHGLHLDARDLGAEFRRPLVDGRGRSTIDRTQPGFEDFCTAGRRGIEPGQPALSLFYHALASPDVYPAVTGARTDADLPTLAELDAVENYLYGLTRRRLGDFDDPVVAVFAYQYRAGTRSVHRVHADMAFSRTGIARVGTAPMHYDPVRRSFWVVPPNGNDGLAVMPARYAAFVAERRKLGPQDRAMSPLHHVVPGDRRRTFLLPVHKLFPGDECLVGQHVDSVAFFEYHRAEKLRRMHRVPVGRGGVQAPPGFDINQPPFVRESRELVTLQPVGASVLLMPAVRSTLVEVATQRNSVSGREEVARFRVPPANPRLLNRGNRFEESSFQIPAGRKGRAGPEYAHIRLHVGKGGQLFDLNTLDSAEFRRVLRRAKLEGVPGVEDGPLEAAHLIDGSCDGALAVEVTLRRQLRRFAAQSIVAAPDFLPLVDQAEVQRWAERYHLEGNVYFAQGGPPPLSYGRDIAPNPTIPDPITHDGAAFDRREAANRTVCAVVGQAPQTPGPPGPLRVSVSTTWLPDGAADVFEPGWDTALFSDEKGAFYVSHGLGSPFAEDAKLCAALNSFWPAAAPDVGRTFGRMTALPLLDEELGLHPRHPRVLARRAASGAGWDGEFGPFFAEKGSQVNFAAMARSDYTVSALRGRLGIGRLGRVDAVEMLERMDAFRECADRIRGRTHMTNFAALLVTAEKVADWSQRRDRFGPTLAGPGYLYVFADYRNEREAPADRRRRVADVVVTYTCQVAAENVGVRKGNAKPQVFARRAR